MERRPDIVAERPLPLMTLVTGPTGPSVAAAGPAPGAGPCFLKNGGQLRRSRWHEDERLTVLSWQRYCRRPTTTASRDWGTPAQRRQFAPPTMDIPDHRHRLLARRASSMDTRPYGPDHPPAHRRAVARP